MPLDAGWSCARERRKTPCLLLLAVYWYACSDQVQTGETWTYSLEFPHPPNHLYMRRVVSLRLCWQEAPRGA
jgi:hypothetical protein